MSLPPLDAFMRAYEASNASFDAGRDEPGDCECGLSMDAHCGGFSLLHHDEFIIRAIHRNLSETDQP